jgi:hypothetical protein
MILTFEARSSNSDEAEPAVVHETEYWNQKEQAQIFRFLRCAR